MKKFAYAMALSLLLVSPLVAQAQGFQLFPGEAAGASDYRTYIKNFYFFSIGAGILIATVLIMVGGIMWTTSAGNPGRIDKAKGYIIDSIIGVVLLLGSYTILQVINPNLVDLRLPSFPKFSTTLGSCVFTTQTQRGFGKQCLDTTQTQCEELARPGQAVPVFTANQPCHKVCAIRDANGFCTLNTDEAFETFVEQAQGEGKSNAQILCELRSPGEKGAEIQQGKVANLFNSVGSTTDHGQCENYCRGAGPNCTVQSVLDEDRGDNIWCKCQYVGSDAK